VNYFNLYNSSRQTYFCLQVNKVRARFTMLETMCRDILLVKQYDLNYFVLNNFLLSFEVYLPFTSSSKMSTLPYTSSRPKRSAVNLALTLLVYKQK